jgi:Ca2+/H+ antiporter, TMEM165/GDT1 family
MFDFNVLISAFILVFISEFGDKTQIAVFAFSATTKKPVTIFLASASALVLSTIIASVLGKVTAHLIPRFTTYIASGLFVLFGIIMLIPRETPLIQDCFAILLSMEQSVKEHLQTVVPQEAERIKIEEETHSVLLRYLIDDKKFFQDDINEEPELQELFQALKKVQLPRKEMDKKEMLRSLIVLEELGIRFYTYLLHHLKREEREERALEIELSAVIREEKGHLSMFRQLFEEQV